MIGQFTEKEIMQKCPECNLKSFMDGILVRKRGKTVNYYRREIDGSWTNYDCRTVDSK